MDFDSFSRQVSDLSRRLASLLESSHSTARFDPKAVSAAFKELGVAVEELEVAVEEINHQNESLALTVDMVEEERSRYEHLFRFAPQAYLVTDLKGQIQEANMVASQLLGLPLEFLIGKPLVVYVQPEARDNFWAELKRRQERDSYQEWELPLEPRNVNVTDVSCLTVAIRDREGQPTSFHWTLRDITGRKRLEQLESNGTVLSDPETLDLLSAWPLHTFSSGDIISLSPQTIWYVHKGLVKLTTLTDHSKEVLLGLLGPGNPFGSSLTALPLHEAIALSDVQLYYISTSEMLDSPKLAQHLLKGMANRLQHTERLLAISGEPNAEKRLCQLLFFLAEKFGAPIEEGIRISLRLTHEDLASACATTRVTVTRLLSKLQEDGKIRLDEKSHIVVLEGCA
ncbi:MAG TPA: helix-turn-helix domain-containing protein [Leptolyngbyaceae cyanobacterium]